MKTSFIISLLLLTVILVGCDWHDVADSVIVVSDGYGGTTIWIDIPERRPHSDRDWWDKNKEWICWPF